MGLFDDDCVTSSPVTAQMLRDILEARMVQKDDNLEIRCSKLLQHIYNRVRYNTEDQITYHDTSLKAIGIEGSPFSHEYTDSINKLIDEGKSDGEICDWIDEHPMKMSNKMREFVSFMNKRGFTVHLLSRKFLAAEDKRNTERVIRISWEEN